MKILKVSDRYLQDWLFYRQICKISFPITPTYKAPHFQGHGHISELQGHGPIYEQHFNLQKYSYIDNEKAIYWMSFTNTNFLQNLAKIVVFKK